MAGGGGLIRDEEGRFIAGFAANYGICTAYRAEFLALEQGLKLAKQRGIRKLIVQMDNKACVEAITNSTQQRNQCIRMALHNPQKLLKVSFYCKPYNLWIHAVTAPSACSVPIDFNDSPSNKGLAV
uniref:RNase H type-1 domain-containing protein n=1 Tax=Chenopodium quinoa TaxID=63459 RepID=A0A803M8R4_CHEQI